MAAPSLRIDVLSTAEAALKRKDLEKRWNALEDAEVQEGGGEDVEVAKEQW